MGTARPASRLWRFLGPLLYYTLLFLPLAVALIVSQTPWFKDWLRRYVVRESEQYLNGQLSIGSLGGNLFFGARLTDVAVDVSGDLRGDLRAAGREPAQRSTLYEVLERYPLTALAA